MSANIKPRGSGRYAYRQAVDVERFLLNNVERSLGPSKRRTGASAVEPRAGYSAPVRALIISHPSVLTVNQLPYVELLRRGWDIRLVVPERWKHEYSEGPFPPEVHPDLEGRLIQLPVLFPGAAQRHIYRRRLAQLVDQFRPDVAFVEQEYFSAAAAQWARVLRKRRVPFGVQAAENLDRPLPIAARIFRAYTLRSASFVAARSPAAGRLARRQSRAGAIFLIPHHIPSWPLNGEKTQPRAYTVGYAGRLVDAKGIDTLIDAASGMVGTTVRLFGDGSSRAQIASHAAHLGVDLHIDSDVRHEDMPGAYAQMDVLVLPSRTTPTWAEQFGRVLVEALWCGVPVIGSSSGEIPWVIQTTGGGLVFPEGDAVALREALDRFRSPSRRAEVSERGRENAKRWFSVEATTDRLETALRAVGPWIDN